MPMHIKLVVNSFPSTSETFLFNLVVGLQAKGHRVSVCALSASKHTELYKGRMNEWSQAVGHYCCSLLPGLVLALT